MTFVAFSARAAVFPFVGTRRFTNVDYAEAFALGFSVSNFLKSVNELI